MTAYNGLYLFILIIRLSIRDSAHPLMRSFFFFLVTQRKCHAISSTLGDGARECETLIH